MRKQALNEIIQELNRAEESFPKWPTDPIHAMGIWVEEVGETMKEVMQMVYEPSKTDKDRLKKEALQAAAMGLRFVESLERYEYEQSKQH